MAKPVDRWIQELVAALHHLDRRTPDMHQPNIVASARDLRDWLTDRRSYNQRHHRQAWDSSFIDFRKSWESCGPRLRGAMKASKSAVEVRFRELIEDRSNAASRGTVVEAVDNLLSELSSDPALRAAWADLVAMCRDADSKPESLMETVGVIRDILRSRGSSTYYSDLGSRLQFLLVGDAILLDGVLILADDSLDTELQGPQITGTESTWMPQDAERDDGQKFIEQQLDSCLGLLLTRPDRDHFVVWFTIRQAWIPSFTLNLGAVQLFDSQWLSSLLFSVHRPSGYVLPAEFEDPENILSKVDFPADPKTLAARVDVGLTLPLFAIQSARDILQGLLLRASPAAKTWQISKTYISFRNGKSAGFSYVAEDPPSFYVPDLDHVTRHLIHLEEASILVDASVDSVLSSVLLLRDELLNTEASSEVVQVITAQRALETLSGVVFAGDLSWIVFVRDYLSKAWSRHELGRTMAIVTTSALLNRNLVDSAETTLLDELRSKIVVFNRGGHITLNFDSLLQESAPLEALFQGSPVAREIRWMRRTLSDGREAAVALSLAQDKIHRTEERLVRIRNAISHGGPARSEVVNSVSYFARSIAFYALGVTVDALLAGKDPKARSKKAESSSLIYADVLPPVVLFSSFGPNYRTERPRRRRVCHQLEHHTFVGFAHRW